MELTFWTVIFYDADGIAILEAISPYDNHWDSVSYGHRILEASTVRGAVDFKVTEDDRL